MRNLLQSYEFIPVADRQRHTYTQTLVHTHIHSAIHCIPSVGRMGTTTARCGRRSKTVQHTAAHCNTLQHTATHCDTLQHTATHCNTLQHIATKETYKAVQHTATHCNILQHTATHCNTLQQKRPTDDLEGSKMSTRSDEFHASRTGTTTARCGRRSKKKLCRMAKCCHA